MRRDLLKPIFFQKEIWHLITQYLGTSYWFHRKKLTELSFALDLIHSDYAWQLSSYYRWKAWREKKQNNWYLTKPFTKPTLPRRFKNWKQNPYIKEVDNYIRLSEPCPNEYSLYYQHEKSRKIVFNFC